VGTNVGSFSNCDSISSVELSAEPSAELPAETSAERSVGWATERSVEPSVEWAAESLACKSVGDIGGTSLSITTDYKMHVQKYPCPQNIYRLTEIAGSAAVWKTLP
jgi:hypothetical protein